MPESPRPFFLAGNPESSLFELPVNAPEDGSLLGLAFLAKSTHIQEAIRLAEASRQALLNETPDTRAKRIRSLSKILDSQGDAFTSSIRDEAGKPQRYAASEVARAIRTLNIAAEEALLNTSKKNIFGDRESVIHPFPIGVCSFITPFNFPLNLAMHKIAPALAAGCPFVLKPAEKTPLTALLLGEALCRVDPPLPKGSWSILPALPDECGPLSDSPLVRHLSFTGSAGVGWELKGRAAHAHTTLELGGNAAAILCEDWNLEDALNRCTIGAFAYSGQVCISLQRLLVPQGIQGEVIDGLGQRIRDLRLGSLSEMETDFGPMIDEASAIRVESWIREAIQEGAQLHCGGNRVGNFVEPTLLSQVSHNSKVWDEEIFGPVLVVEEWSDFSKALDAVNETRWGLQAALFTHNEQRINSAFRNLEVGQVIIGDSTVFRVDDMPYGGVKASGCGREGVRWAMEAMQETRLLVRAPKS